MAKYTRIRKDSKGIIRFLPYSQIDFLHPNEIGVLDRRRGDSRVYYQRRDYKVKSPCDKSRGFLYNNGEKGETSPKPDKPAFVPLRGTLAKASNIKILSE
jgi:hypothetical protein